MDKAGGTRACARDSMIRDQRGVSEEHWDPRSQSDKWTQAAAGRMLLQEEVVLEAVSIEKIERRRSRQFEGRSIQIRVVTRKRHQNSEKS